MNAPRRDVDEVSPLDLFSDLVYVFGVAQVSHHLLAHPTWTGAAETFALYVPMFAVWLQTAWTSVVLIAARGHAALLYLAVMLLGLFMNASLGDAFGATTWIFVGLYLAINLGRNLWVIRLSRLPWVLDHYQRMLIWFAAGAIFWLLGAADEQRRLAWWVVAAVIDGLGIARAHPLPRRRMRTQNEEIPRFRTFERARLFFIIALGETILTTGVAIAAHLKDPITLLTGTIALAGTVAIWWTYFDAREPAAREGLRASNDPTRYSVGTFNVVFGMVAALIIIAVGDESVIAHPYGSTDLRLVLLLYLGPALYFVVQAEQAYVLRLDSGRTRLVALAALVVLAGVSFFVPPFVAAIGAAAPLVGVAIADGRRGRF